MKANFSKYAGEKVQSINFLPVRKTTIPVISALMAIAAALVFSTALLGRPAGVWELLLCGIGGLIFALIILKFRQRQERKHLDSIRDSALW